MEISCAFPTTLDSPEQIVARRAARLRAGLAVRHAAAERRRLDDARAGGASAPSGSASDRACSCPRCATRWSTPPPPRRSRRSPRAGSSSRSAPGFTGRRAMGYRAITWSFMDDYIRAYRGLLRGETIEWEGARMQMLHPPGHAAPRPIDVPIIIGALGPKGAAVARELGDGLYITLALPGVRAASSRGSRTCSGARSSTTARTRTPTACARPAARAGRSPTTAPTSSARRSRTCPAAREWKAVDRADAPRRSATSPSTPGTASASTRPTSAAWEAGGDRDAATT